MGGSYALPLALASVTFLAIGCRTRLLDAAPAAGTEAGVPDLTVSGADSAPPPPAGDAFPCTALHTDIEPGATAPHLALDPFGSFTVEAWVYSEPSENGGAAVLLGMPNNPEWALTIIRGET